MVWKQSEVDRALEYVMRALTQSVVDQVAFDAGAIGRCTRRMGSGENVDFLQKREYRSQE